MEPQNSSLSLKNTGTENSKLDLEAAKSALIKLGVQKHDSGPYLIAAFYHSNQKLLRSAAIIAAANYDDEFNRSLLKGAIDSSQFADRSSAAKSINLQRNQDRKSILKESLLSSLDLFYIYSALHKFGSNQEQKNTALKWLHFLSEDEEKKVKDKALSYLSTIR